MLAIPEAERSCAKLRSAAAAPSGTPSSKICCPEAPRRRPLSPLSFMAARNSFQVVSNCASVGTWPNSYSRANFNKMLRLRTNGRAVALVSVLIACGEKLSRLVLATYNTSASCAERQGFRRGLYTSDSYKRARKRALVWTVLLTLLLFAGSHTMRVTLGGERRCQAQRSQCNTEVPADR